MSTLRLPSKHSHRASGPKIRLLSATGAGSCLAVGGYGTSSLHLAPMDAVESGGRWHAATASVRLPRGAATGSQAQARLFSESCFVRRTRVTVGYYLTKGAEMEAMAGTLPPP